MELTREIIETLLKEDEGNELDFKRDQYPFDKASDEQKGELLKDLLAFANTDRTRDAFILIGCDESIQSADGSVHVRGINNHLDDANLQQFVNGKTNRHMRFAYRRMSLRGQQIGVLQIPVQRRPIFLRRDFGRLKEKAVYFRTGSSTSIAGPDEIHQMGQEDSRPQQTEPELSFQFFNRKSGEQYGSQVSVTCTWINMPPPAKIPDYPIRKKTNYLTDFADLNSINPWNRNYLREMAKFRQVKAFLQPVSLSILNSSSVIAKDVRLIMEVEEESRQYYFSTEEKMPSKPTSTHNFLNQVPQIDLGSIGSGIDVSRTGKKWRIEIRFRKIQAGDTVWLNEDLFVGSRHEGIVPINAKLFADNLGNPREIEVGIRIQSRSQTFSLEDLA